MKELENFSTFTKSLADPDNMHTLDLRELVRWHHV